MPCLQIALMKNSTNCFKTKFDAGIFEPKSICQKSLSAESLDQMVALKAKTLAGFQVSYEVLVNRKINIDRMQMQNALMQRDLAPIANEADNDKVSKFL